MAHTLATITPCQLFALTSAMRQDTQLLYDLPNCCCGVRRVPQQSCSADLCVHMPAVTCVLEEGIRTRYQKRSQNQKQQQQQSFVCAHMCMLTANQLSSNPWAADRAKKTLGFRKQICQQPGLQVCEHPYSVNATV